MHATGSQIAGRINRITCRAAQRQPDHPDRKRHRQRPYGAQTDRQRTVAILQRQLAARDIEHDKHQGKSPDSFRQEINRRMADGRTGTEHAQYGIWIVRRFKMVFINKPD